jgi:hypothetical protein
MDQVVVWNSFPVACSRIQTGQDLVGHSSADLMVAGMERAHVVVLVEMFHDLFGSPDSHQLFAAVLGTVGSLALVELQE